ncbi:MAG: type II toxin-antitoxin system PrlF family antitoxin [Hyphomicrobiales bacterium]|nr:type II toxin-antitoxin system PrlF family antitoxin [Hyphomicrobiales bacterium]MBV8825244.1 type II toxin-antitoxin system PrlF family antitoxin [Hyphomicrobiales bacterium]MBV9427366.1 type II toxin-antitoxin system PrlF family antitoxin [Bradyrhizobiaceae bacterium]
MARTDRTSASRMASASKASVSYAGTITTTGKSQAIRLEKALFRSHPEFRQKTKVQAHVIGPGTMLVSVTDPDETESAEDPVIAAFLSFLDREIEHAPERIKPLSATRIEEARSLTKDVEVSDDESLPDDVTL